MTNAEAWFNIALRPRKPEASYISGGYTGFYKARGSSKDRLRVPGLCESGGGRPGLPVPNSPYGLCGRRAALNLWFYQSSRAV